MEDNIPRCCRAPGMISMHRREFCSRCFRVRNSIDQLTYSLFMCSYCGEIYPPDKIQTALLCSSCLPECRLYSIPLYHLSKTRVQSGICCDHCGNPVGHDEQMDIND